MQDNSLLKPNEGDTGEADWKLDMVELFKAGKIAEARKTAYAVLSAQKKWKRSTAGFMTTLNCSATDEQQDTAVLTIKQGLVDHTLVSRPGD